MTKSSLICALLASASLTACGSQAQPSAPVPPVPVLALDVEGSQGGRTLSVGTVRATDSHELATEHGGRVIAFTANVGDRVSRGQVLARLDPAAFRAAADAAQANLIQAQAAAAAARSHAKRVHGLADTGVASQGENESAASAAAQAEQQLAAAGAEARLAHRNLSLTSIVSPTDGVVAARHAALSSLVPPGGALFSIDGSGSLEIEARIPGSVADKIRAGDIASFRYGSDQGRARLVGFSRRGDGVDVRQARFVVVEGTPAPGVAVEVSLQARHTDTHSMSTVPLSAVLGDRERGGHRVLAIAANGKLEAIPIEIVEVTSLGAEVRGAVAGRKIVAAGAGNLSLDRRVRPVPYTF